MKPSFFAAPYVVAASTFAAAALVSAASADVTYTLTNATFTGFNFVQAYGPGWPFGTLTGVRINVTLTASTNYTYADDLCVYVDAPPFGLGGLLQCGGFSSLNAAQRYSWPNGFSNAPGTTSVGTVNFTTGIEIANSNPPLSIWIGNGYSAAGTSGTWTGTITLIGVEDSGTCLIDTDLDGRSDCYDNCINIANSNQLNTDGDTSGDACDNCPLIANSNQADCNDNGVGNACEIAAGAPDFNQDTIPDTCQCGTIPSLPACCPGGLDCSDVLVQCWGNNGSGRCNTPAELGPCSNVAGGYEHSIALQSNGTVRCWGSDGWGAPRNTPADLGPCVSVAGGYQHTIAIRTDGTVRCWGDNYFGQCNTPADLGPCSSVSGGRCHTIALLSAGNVRCWGSGGFKGDYNYGQFTTPSDLGPCSRVAGGLYHSIALRISGTVRCWGNNSYGQCNTPSNLEACSSIAGGDYHTIALQSNGNVRCWGYNASGQCNTPSDLGPCSSVAAGGSHCIALRTDGIVRCWGNNFYGQCNTPSNLGACSSIAGGGSHTIAVKRRTPLDTDGDGRPDSIDNCPTIANPTQADCNSNSIGDACEVASGAPDYNHDAIPDTCQCLADLVVNHEVNGADLGALLAVWGPANPSLPSADINRDGSVDGADLGYLLYAWGPCTN
jgi:hypothetical protein